MYPVLIKAGNLTISSYSFFLTLGFIVAMIYSFQESKKKGIDQNHTTIFFLILFFSLTFFSRFISLIITNPKALTSNPAVVLTFWKGSRTSWAAWIIGIVAGLLYTKRQKISLWKFADTITPGLLLGIAIAKIGCLMAGCCYGKPTNVFWAITLHGSGRHPTQVYQTLFCLIIFVFVLYLKRKSKFDGQVFLIAFGILYPLARMIEELFRENIIYVFNSFSFTHMICFLIIVIASILLNELKVKHFAELSNNSAQIIKIISHKAFKS